MYSLALHCKAANGCPEQEVIEPNYYISIILVCPPQSLPIAISSCIHAHIDTLQTDRQTDRTTDRYTDNLTD